MLHMPSSEDSCCLKVDAALARELGVVADPWLLACTHKEGGGGWERRLRVGLLERWELASMH